MSESHDTGQQRIRLLFDQVIDCQTPSEQDALLEIWSTTADARFLPELRRLLAADRELGSPPSAGDGPKPAPDLLPAFGPYQATGVLGRGGMGAVYLACRQDGQFDRKVAVKVVLTPIVDAVGRAQFLRERQILAGLQHPGIAAMIDGGVLPDGTPYLVMEFVDGKHLDAYCNERKLTVRQRIDLLREICDAVSFAHRNLVVHRDLKPSNILVAASGKPKLLDFGTARIVSDDQTLGPAMLTPRYASPEQLRKEAVSTAADTYALGVILAELLTGRWPFGDPKSSVDALRRAVEAVEPSPLDRDPSAEHAGLCSTPVARYRAELTGDLNAIVARCLDPEASRRYRSVDEFSEDLRRYLNREPVLAQPQSAGYRLRKLVSRHRAATAAIAAALLAITATTALALIAERRARVAANRADVSRTVLRDVFQAVGRSKDQRIRAEDLLSSGRELSRLSSLDPAVKSDLLVTFSAISSSIGDEVASAKLAREALDLSRSSDDKAGQGIAASRLASALLNLGQFAEAESIARQALLLTSGHGNDPAKLRIHLEALHSLTYCFAWGPMQAPSDVDTILKDLEKTPAEGNVAIAFLSGIWANVATIRAKQGNPEAEARALDHALRHFRAAPSGDLSLILERMRARSLAQGDFAASESFGRERLALVESSSGRDKLPVTHPALLLAQTLARSGKLDEAEELWKRSDRILSTVDANDAAVVDWLAHTTGAMLAAYRGSGRQSEELARKALKSSARFGNDRDPRVAQNRLQLGYALRLQSRFAESLVELERAQRDLDAAGLLYRSRANESREQANRARARDASVFPSHLK